MKNISDYVLARRANPSLRDDKDLECMAKAEAKRQRRSERRGKEKEENQQT
jgi:hypothetical protein